MCCWCKVLYLYCVIGELIYVDLWCVDVDLKLFLLWLILFWGVMLIWSDWGCKCWFDCWECLVESFLFLLVDMFFYIIDYLLGYDFFDVV